MAKRLTTELFINKARAVHGERYDYSDTDYVKSSMKVVITCLVHGPFEQRPNRHLQGDGCPRCGREESAAKQRFTLEEFIVGSNKIHNNKYDYSEIDGSTFSLKDLVVISCPIHGRFSQIADVHLRGSGCVMCYRERSSVNMTVSHDDYIAAVRRVHGDLYDLSMIQYTSAHDCIKVGCPIHGVWQPKAYSFRAGSGCPSCSSIKSKSELELFEWICSVAPDGQWESGNRTVLPGNLELDIYSPVYKIAIEYNGVYWHSSGNVSTDLVCKSKHLNKTSMCHDRGVRLFHIFETDSMTAWKSMMLANLNLNQRIYARKCHVGVIPIADATGFIKSNHLQGSCRGSVAIGLHYNDELVSICLFGKARYSSCDWELLRMCSKSGITVVGGASKMLAAFRRDYSGSVVSYANKRWSVGSVYEQLGFKHIRDSEPCHWYVKNGSVWHRSRFMKHKLHKVLGEFDPSQTEVENMYNHGYRRIWDCGNKVYLLE